MKLPNVAHKVPRGLSLIILGLIVFSFGLIVCGFQGCSGGSSSPSTSPSSPPTAVALPAFPLVASPNHRYLQDQKGVPFPILGRTAWFITSLSEAEYKLFIDDTVAKGYNAIEFHVINHDPRGNQPPFGGNGTLLPFTKQVDGVNNWSGELYPKYSDINVEAPDFTTPNELYWKHVDALLAYAESKGVLCFMFPAYTGSQGGDQGWMQEMVANGVLKMTDYGTFIANRYKTRGNIVWMLGGDYGPFSRLPEELDVEKAMLAGMQIVARQLSTNFSAEWTGSSIYTDIGDATLLAAGTLQGAYSFSGDVNTYARNGYNYSVHVMPTFLLEEPYDEEGPGELNRNGAATQPVRRFQWWGWLSGIGGYISGNGCVWPFNPSTLLPLSPCFDGWQAHLNTQGAQDMARLNAFIRSIAWYNLVPSGLDRMRTLVVNNSSPSSIGYVAAAASSDGTLLVAYVPPAHQGPITIDMTGMSDPIRARCFNPTTAAYTDAAGIPLPGTQMQFTPPPSACRGSDDDWVLLLEKQ